MNNNILILLILLMTTTSSYSKDCIKDSQKLFNAGKYSQSIKLINECLEDAIDSKDNNLISDLYYGLGINYYNKGELDSALKYYLVADFTLKKIDNQKLTAMVNNELALTYSDKGMNHKAIYYLKKSIILNSELGRNKDLARNYINLGRSFGNLMIIDSSLIYYEKASESKALDKDLKATIYNNLSFIYNAKNEYEESRQYLSKALATKGLVESKKLLYKSNYDLILISEKLSPIYFVADDYLMLGSNTNDLILADAHFKASAYNLYNNDFEKALFHLNKANSIYVSEKNITKAKEITKDFISISKNLGNTDISEVISDYKKFEDQESLIYSNLLLKETELNLKTEESIFELSEKLNTANININILIAFIICLVILIPVAIRVLVLNKLMASLKENQLRFRDSLIQLHDKGIKNNLGKLISIMVISNKFKDDDIFVEIIDEIAKDSNKLTRVINNNKLIWSKNANTSSTIKLPMGR